MASSLVRELIDAGIHFGHRVSRWNPKMEPYIFGKRNLIHVIDIKETLRGLLRAKKFIAQVVADGGDVLFVGTKRQARQAIETHAKRCGMHYVTDRWLGGTLTNFRTIRSRLARLEELEALEASGELDKYSKKMKATLQREKRKIYRNLSGIRRMERLPAALIVVDVRREHIAVKEAKKLGIPTVCLIDTDGDPDYADIPIPGNDDAMRAVELIVSHLADAVEEGKKGRTEVGAELPAPRRRTRRPITARAAGGPDSSEQPPAPPGPEPSVSQVQAQGPDTQAPAAEPDRTGPT
ncbi:MAG: 30S ribosomal protein S2 [Phycisphaerae bacterium]